MSAIFPRHERKMLKYEDERYVLGEVYLPVEYLLDTDREFMSEATLRRMAHRFLMEGRIDKIDRAHDFVSSGNLVAECFVVRGDFDPDFRRAAWVLGAYIVEDEDWRKVKSGEWNGWSWGGDAFVLPVEREIQVPIRMYGSTEPWPVNDPDAHWHDLDVMFKDDGTSVLAGITSVTLGHYHIIGRTTATEEAAGHSHRIVMRD